MSTPSAASTASRPTTILVTGATGKVGRHLVTGLLAEGVPVRALTRKPEAADLPAAAELAPADPAQLAAAVAGTSAVFVNTTAAGDYIGELMTQAVQAGVRRVVMLSSLTVRDNGTQPYSIGAQHYAGREAEMYPDLELVLGRPAMTFADWAAGHAASFR